MQSANEVHEEHVRKTTEKHQLAVHQYKRRKVNALTRDKVVPKIALYARDQQVPVHDANVNEERKKLKSLEKSNKKLEKLNTLLEAKECLLRSAQSDGQQRRIEGGTDSRRQGRHSTEGDEMRHSVEKSKEEKDTEIKELEAQKQDLKHTNLALRKKKDSLLHKKYPRH